MTPDEFLVKLNQNNPRYAEFVRFIKASSDDFRFARKDKNLIDVVESFRAIGYDPVIDKKLRIVIGCTAHRAIRAQLYRYHKADSQPEDTTGFSTDENSIHADAYTDEGMGYHFSSMSAVSEALGGRVRPIVGLNYRPDKFDQDLFHFYVEEHPL